MGGTWELSVNRVRVGAGDLYQLGDEFGEAEHTLTVDEMPSHRHEWAVPRTSASGSVTTGTGIPPHNNTQSGNNVSQPTGYIGGGSAHNNLQPSYAVYMWHRIA